MTSPEFPFQLKSEWVDTDKLMVPDRSLFTAVTPPEQLVLNDKQSVVSWIDGMTQEEMARNTQYMGLFLFGSVAEGEAVGSSDLDLLHVVTPLNGESEYRIAEPIKYRLKALVECCFGVTLDDHVLDFSKPATWANDAERLNRFSIPIGIPAHLVREIQLRTGLHHRGKYEGYRPYKQPSRDRDMPRFSYPTGGIFPWWADYGLLTRTDDYSKSDQE